MKGTCPVSKFGPYPQRCEPTSYRSCYLYFEKRVSNYHSIGVKYRTPWHIQCLVVVSTAHYSPVLRTLSFVSKDPEKPILRKMMIPSRLIPWINSLWLLHIYTYIYIHTHVYICSIYIYICIYIYMLHMYIYIYIHMYAFYTSLVSKDRPNRFVCESSGYLLPKTHW